MCNLSLVQQPLQFCPKGKTGNPLDCRLEARDLYMTIPAYAMLCEHPNNLQFAEEREQKQEQEQGLRQPQILLESTLLSDCSCFCSCFCSCSLQIPICRTPEL